MKKVLSAAASIVPILLLIIVYIGDTFRQSVVSVSVFLALLTLLILGALRWDSAPRASTPNGDGLFAGGPTAWWLRAAGLLGLGFLWLLLSKQRYQGMIIFPDGITGRNAAAVVSAICLSVLVIKPPKPWMSLFVLIVAGLSVRCLWFPAWEINPARRDMLALVISAIERFLSFENPYGFHQMQRGSEVPLTYPPGLWLAHLPAYVAGLDIRWTAWLSDAIIPLCLGGAAIRHRSGTVGPVMAALSVYLFLPDIHWNGIYAEPHADWAVLAALIFSTMSRRPLLSGVLFGVALTTRPFNLVLLPFFAVWLYRGFGLRKAWEAALIAGTITAAVYLPFVLWDPDAFFAGTTRWLLDYGPAHRTWFHAKMSFSGLLYQHHMEHLMAPAQLILLVVGAALAIWKLKTTRHLLAFWMGMYALFVAFNSIVWMSFWIGVCLLAVALIGAAGDAKTAAEPEAHPAARFVRKRLIPEVVPAVGIVSALGLMLFFLHRHFDDTGLDEVREYLKDEVEPSDFIVDNSGYRKAILKTPFLFDRATLPKGVALGTTLFKTVLPRRRFSEPIRQNRIFAVERFDLFDEKAPVLIAAPAAGAETAPFERIYTKRFGNYTLHLFENSARGAAVGRLTDHPEALHIRGVTEHGDSTGTLKDNRWRFGGPAKRARAAMERCRIDGTDVTMIAVKPTSDVTYILTFDIGAGAERLSLFGGLPDRAAVWHRSSIWMTVETGRGDRLGEIVFPNFSGMRGATYALPEGTEQVRVSIITDAPENPKFCLEGELWAK